MQSTSKKLRKFTVPKLNVTDNCGWVSEYRIVNISDEVGDGASSRVYKGFLDDKIVAVKQLKMYSP